MNKINNNELNKDDELILIDNINNKDCVDIENIDSENLKNSIKEVKKEENSENDILITENKFNDIKNCKKRKFKDT